MVQHPSPFYVDIFIYIHFLNHTDDIASANSCWPLTKIAWALSQASQCRICGEQSNTLGQVLV